MKFPNDQSILSLTGGGFLGLTPAAAYFGGSATAILCLVQLAITCIVGAIVLGAIKKTSKPRCPRANRENHNPSACVICLGWK
jgi:hypothetical protein